MENLLFLAFALAASALVSAVRNTANISSFLVRKFAKRQMLPKAVTTLMAAAQLSELVRIVEHVSIVHVVGAIMLLVILLAAKTGTGEEHG